MLKNLLEKSFLLYLFQEARFSHAKKYLIKSLFHELDPYKTFVLAKDRESSLCIWALKQIKHRRAHFSDDLYFWDFDGESWLGNLHHIYGLYEYLSGLFSVIYSCDYKNKTVLDIGGYIGDTARFFLLHGARKVIIYEPVPKNLLCLAHNLKKEKEIHALEIFPKAVAEVDGEVLIESNYPEGHIGFGNREGKYALRVAGASFETILSHVKADIAKIDCEGYEKHLLKVSKQALCLIPYWMIEIHDNSLLQLLDQKFQNAGYSVEAIPVPPGHMQIHHYRR